MTFPFGGLTATLAALVFATLSCGPVRAAEEIQPAYDRLVQALENAEAPSGRAEVSRAAQVLKEAIADDGGARGALTDVATNIANSLHDGSFSAEASLKALREITPRTVLDAGPWRPGAPYPQSVGLEVHQKGVGDCVGISALRAFAATPAGEAILRSSVARAPDGGFLVNLPGAPERVFRVPDEALAQYGSGDPAAAAIIGALFQYFGLDPHHAALPTNKVMELLAGRLGRHARLADAKMSALEIERYLLQNASTVGVDTAMVFGGKPAHGGDWSRGDGHAFAAIRIDPLSRTVTYTNPWNEGRLRTISVSELAAGASGTSADFETVRFQPFTTDQPPARQTASLR